MSFNRSINFLVRTAGRASSATASCPRNVFDSDAVFGLPLFGAQRLIAALLPVTPVKQRAYSTADLKEEAYATEIEQLRSKIFGTHIGNGLRSGRKLLRKPLIGHKIASYYLQPMGKGDPLFLDERIERMGAKLAKLKRRGKGPPKKGQGKRAGKRKARA